MKVVLKTTMGFIRFTEEEIIFEDDINNADIFEDNDKTLFPDYNYVLQEIDEADLPIKSKDIEVVEIEISAKTS